MNLLFEHLKHETIEINQQVYPFVDLLQIDATNLSQEYSQQAAMYGYIGMLCAQAEADYNDAKTNKDAAYAEVELQVRTAARKQSADAPEIKVTEGLVKSMVIMDDVYMEAAMLENRALAAWKKLRALADAFKQRGEMMISLGATLRQEYDMTSMTLLNTKEQLRQYRQDGS